MMTKGKVSPLLAAILQSKEARERLRKVLATGEEFTIRIGDKTYRVTTSNQNAVLPSGNTETKNSNGVPQPT